MTTLQQNGLIRLPLLEHYGDLMSVKDLSSFFGVSSQTIYRELRDGKFGKPLKIGREHRIPKVYVLEKYFHGS